MTRPFMSATLVLSAWVASPPGLPLPEILDSVRQSHAAVRTYRADVEWQEMLPIFC